MTTLPETLDTFFNDNNTPTGDTWPTPDPIIGQTEPPPFPVHVFPEWIRSQIDVAATEMQCPPDLPAQLAITALSICAAGRVKVHVSSSWYEPTNTYLVTGLRPGENKSPNVKMMLGPLDEWEQELQEAAERDRGRIETQRKILTKQHSKAVEKGELAEALSIQDELDTLPDTTPPRIIADDSTPEKMVDLLQQHGGRIAIVSTEGGVFQLMTGRYSEKSNLDVYLMAWSGDTIRVDRIGRDGAVVRNPCLTIGLTVQPSVIEKLSETPELRGRGLTARFMYSVPRSRVGRRDMRRITSVDHAITSLYASHLKGLAATLHAYTDTITVSMSPEALETFVAWRQDLEDRRTPNGDLNIMVDWTIKLESTVARLAGLLHLADGGRHGGDINVDVMERAIEVGRYWEAHARIAHELWLPDPVVANAARILRWAIDCGRPTFTVRDAYSVNRSTMPRAEDAVEPLQILIEKGWVRLEAGAELEVGKRGRKSPTVTVHPDAATLYGQVVPMRVMRVKPFSEDFSSLPVKGSTDVQVDAHDAHTTQLTPEPPPMENPVNQPEEMF
jgi:replicative DNA helicase